MLYEVITLEPKPLGPARDGNYWFVWNQIERQLSINPVTGMDFSDAWKGMKLTMYDLRFIADAARILPEERERIDGIAAALKQAGPLARFVVEGHTASVGKPAGELELSILRSVTVAEELARRGIPVITSYSIHYTKLYEKPDGEARDSGVDLNQSRRGRKGIGPPSGSNVVLRREG